MLRAWFALFLLTASTAAHGATELGGGFNGQLGDISNSLIAKSGVRIVRVFVDITRNYVTYTARSEPDCSTAWCVTDVMWSNICSQPKGTEMICPTEQVTNPESGQGISNVLPIYAVSKLAAIKSLGCQTVTEGVAPVGRPTFCQDVKIILSLKTDFNYGPASEILNDTTFGSQQIVIDAIAALLLNGDLGNVVDYLVLGNEPMFEVPAGQADAYKEFLVRLATKVNTLRTSNSWTFRMFSGSLDRPGYACCPGNPYCTSWEPTPGCINEANSETAIRVIEATQQVNRAGPPFVIQGIDLHEHVNSISDVDRDVAWVKDRFAVNPVPGFSPAFISTEFSLILNWQKQLNSGTPSLCTTINTLVRNVAQGTPISGRDFSRYLRRNPGVSSPGWFKQFYCSLNRNGFEAATYGLVRENQFPYQLDLLNDGVCPAPYNNAGHITTTPWVMVSAYNGALLGTNRDGSAAYPTREVPFQVPSFGYYNENPLVFPDFAQIVFAKRKYGNPVCP